MNIDMRTKLTRVRDLVADAAMLAGGVSSIALGLEDSDTTDFSSVAPALVRLLDALQDEMIEADEMLAAVTKTPDNTKTIGA